VATTSRQDRQPSVLLAHADPAWMDQARGRLERAGIQVTSCPEPAWALDLLEGDARFHLVAVSSETDLSTQAQLLEAVRRMRKPPKLMLLLDRLDSSSIHVRQDGFLAHRLSDDLDAFVREVEAHLRPPPRPR
jgi:hypothetical protein